MSFPITKTRLMLPLSHLLLLLLSSTSLAKDHFDGDDTSPKFTWIHPASGTAFKSGDALKAEWSSDRDVVSPSFKLCESSTSSRPRRSHKEMNKHFRLLARSNSDNCGDTVWPPVQRTGGGSCFVSLETPTVSAQSSYYLVMEDDFGSVMQSPTFSVSPEQLPSTDTVPMSSADTSASASSTLVPQAVQASLSQRSAPTALSSSTNSTTKPTASVAKGPIYIDSSNLLTHNRPPPVAAYAIPVSAAAAALLFAGGMAIRHRRALQKEREQDKMTIKILELHGSATFSSSTPSLPTLPSSAPQLPQVHVQPVPVFMPIPVSISMGQASSSDMLNYPQTGDPRQCTRQAYQSPLGTVTRTYRYSSSNGYPHQSRVSTLSSIKSTSSRSLVLEAGSTGERSSSTAPYLPPLSFNSAHYSDLLEDYCLPSPHFSSAHHGLPQPPTQLCTATFSPTKSSSLPPSLLSAPPRLHVRDEAPNGTLDLLGKHGNDFGGKRSSQGASRTRSLIREQEDAYAAVASLLNKS